MSNRLNCWEVKKCGREPGGKSVATLGVCPAASEGLDCKALVVLMPEKDKTAG